MDPSLLQTFSHNLHKIINLNILLVVHVTQKAFVKLKEQLVQ